MADILPFKQALMIIEERCECRTVTLQVSWKLTGDMGGGYVMYNIPLKQLQHVKKLVLDAATELGIAEVSFIAR